MERRTKNEERRTVSGIPAAFTLVELMVVVAIIAILLMLLIPNIRTVREKAWSANCQNNLRQYGVAMNQYMADNNGDFIYAGASGVGAPGAQIGDTDAQILSGGTISLAPYSGGIYAGGGGIAGSSRASWVDMIAAYLPTGVTIQSLSAGNPSIRVCPAVMQQLKKDGNFFDPESANFKGYQDITDAQGNELTFSDFESRGNGYDENNKLILDPGFTTYAINQNKLYQSSSNCPANVIAFIDWNARDGWWATLNPQNAAWQPTWQFSNPTNNIVQGNPKWTNAWWLSEVGFHHLQGNVYGANYVAMDGHVGWVSSNAISITNFTGQ